AATPAYMAPEQARGDSAAIDRRTDVYGLGATLYETLTGVPPFGGGSTQVLMDVLTEEPQRPRRLDPDIPEELETITLKCLEKEPEKRYDSARALAQDLERWLAGEPIHARKASIRERLVKKARKNRALVAVAAGALAVTLVFAAFGVSAQREAAERARLAALFGQRVRQLETVERLSEMLPLHDVRPEM